MAHKGSLREFQAHLAAQLSAAGQRGAVSLLGVQSGGIGWLLDLPESGEIVSVGDIAAVPLTKNWFLGMTNIRGNLYAVTDFSLFCGGDATPQNASSRLLLVGTRYGLNVALLMNRLLGLRNIEDLTEEPATQGHPQWLPQAYRDKQGGLWSKLSVKDLLVDPGFMQVGV